MVKQLTLNKGHSLMQELLSAELQTSTGQLAGNAESCEYQSVTRVIAYVCQLVKQHVVTNYPDAYTKRLKEDRFNTAFFKLTPMVNQGCFFNKARGGGYKQTYFHALHQHYYDIADGGYLPSALTPEHLQISNGAAVPATLQHINMTSNTALTNRSPKTMQSTCHTASSTTQSTTQSTLELAEEDLLSVAYFLTAVTRHCNSAVSILSGLKLDSSLNELFLVVLSGLLDSQLDKTEKIDAVSKHFLFWNRQVMYCQLLEAINYAQSLDISLGSIDVKAAKAQLYATAFKQPELGSQVASELEPGCIIPFSVKLQDLIIFHKDVFIKLLEVGLDYAELEWHSQAIERQLVQFGESYMYAYLDLAQSHNLGLTQRQARQIMEYHNVAPNQQSNLLEACQNKQFHSIDKHLSALMRHSSGQLEAFYHQELQILNKKLNFRSKQLIKDFATSLSYGKGLYHSMHIYHEILLGCSSKTREFVMNILNRCSSNRDYRLFIVNHL